MQSIGEQIKSLRKKAGISASQLAKCSGLSKSYISYLEAGIHNNPSIEVLRKLAPYLHVEVHDLKNNNLINKNIDPRFSDLIELIMEAELDEYETQYLYSKVKTIIDSFKKSNE